MNTKIGFVLALDLIVGAIGTATLLTFQQPIIDYLRSAAGLLAAASAC